MSGAIASDSLWYYARDKQRLGPVPFRGLQQLIETGDLRSSDMVLAEGAAKWTAAGAP